MCVRAPSGAACREVPTRRGFGIRATLRRVATRLSVSIALTALLCAAPPVFAEDVAKPAGSMVQLRYALTLPARHDPEVAYPAVLALAPGPQNDEMVDIAHRAYWDHAERRGWIVVSPVAPPGRLFFDGSEKLIPPLLEDLRERYRVEGNAFHVAGISNGGIAAFRVAEDTPLLFCSLLAAPGLPGSEDDFERLARLRHIPVHMVVGEGDAKWLTRMRATEAKLRELEVPVELVVLPDQGHVIAPAFPESAVFAQLEAQRAGCRHGEPRRAAAAKAASNTSP